MKVLRNNEQFWNTYDFVLIKGNGDLKNICALKEEMLCVYTSITEVTHVEMPANQITL